MGSSSQRKYLVNSYGAKFKAQKNIVESGLKIIYKQRRLELPRIRRLQDENNKLIEVLFWQTANTSARYSHTCSFVGGSFSMSLVHFLFVAIFVRESMGTVCEKSR